MRPDGTERHWETIMCGEWSSCHQPLSLSNWAIGVVSPFIRFDHQQQRSHYSQAILVMILGPRRDRSRYPLVSNTDQQYPRQDGRTIPLTKAVFPFGGRGGEKLGELHCNHTSRMLGHNFRKELNILLNCVICIMRLLG